MRRAENLPPGPPLDPVAAIARHLREGDEVIRCAAARALGALGDATAAPLLVDALLDEDPDVRSDAMAALASCARPEDAAAISRSLMGDPVKEVKVAAIQVLCNLKDEACVPRLRALAKDRCEGDVDWEDGAGMWDDWLDVQIAAIEALGVLGAREAIDDLLEVRSDELGQDLDLVVFAALAQIPEGGIAALLGLLRDRDARVRERALGALSKAAGDLLAPMNDLFILDASPDVRRLAIGGVRHDSSAASDLALKDPDATVRRAALAAFASLRRDIAVAALADEDETARAIALEGIMAGPEGADAGDFAANVQAWMETGGARLAASCAVVLSQLPGAEAGDALSRTASDRDRPQEVRIAAIRSLGVLGAQGAIETLGDLVVDPAQQVRTSALAALAELARAGPEPHLSTAQDLLVGAIRGDLSAEADPSVTAEPGRPPFLGAARGEDAAARHIRITPDGEIVPTTPHPDSLPDEGSPDGPESNVIEGRFPKSTLEAIQAPAADRSDPAKAPLPQTDGGRRRRVAVDGPDDKDGDIRVAALRVAGDCPGGKIEVALAEVLGEANDRFHLAAIAAIAQRSEQMPLPADLVAKLTPALGHPDPRVRGHAARAVTASSPNAADHLAALLDDPDAIVRSLALRSLAAAVPDRAIAGCRDASALVRRAAIEGLLECGTAAELEEGLRVCLEEGWTDSLAEASKRSDEARDILISALAEEKLPRRQTWAALGAIASASPPPGAAGGSP